MRNRPGPFPTGFQAALLYLALLLSEVMVSSALRDAQGLLNLSQMQRSALTLLLGNGLVFVLVMHFRGLTYRGLFHDSRSSARATFFLVVPPVLMLVPALLLVMGVVQQGLQWAFPLSAWEQQHFDRMSGLGIASLVAVCVLAPVLEEMLFRGVILRGFLEQYPRPMAILGSAVLFGAAHLNIYQFVLGVVMGALLGWLYERTRSLIPCIALHGVYNTGTVAIANFGSDAEGWRGAEPVFWASAVVLASMGAFALRAMLVRPKPTAEGVLD